MEHVVIPDGGGQYLPFARNLIRKLRALGLYSGSQIAEVDGYLIRARFSGPNQRISITGGGWLAYPVAVDLRTSKIHVKPTVDATPHIPVPGPVEVPFVLDPPANYVLVPGYSTYSIREIYHAETSPFPPDPYIGQQGGGYSEGWYSVLQDDGGPVPTYEQIQSGEIPTQGIWTKSEIWKYTLIMIDGGGYREDWVYYGIQDKTEGLQERREYMELFNSTNDSLRIEHFAAIAHNDAELARERAAYQDWFANVHLPYEAALAAWLASEAAAIAARNAEIAAAKTAARFVARPEQIARLYAEIDQGVNAPWISFGTFPPPITPRVKHAKPSPFSVKQYTTEPATDDDEVVITITDADGAERDEMGTRKNEGQGGIPASCMLTYGRSVVDNMLVDRMVQVHAPFGREYLINPNQSFGYFATGYTEQLEGGVQTTATFTTPPEYYDWLNSGMTAAGVDDVIESDAYVMPGAVLLLVHFEWETRDPFLDEWTWTPVPYALRYDAIYLCDSTDVTGQDFIPSSPVRKVRLRKVTKQVLGANWVWSAPVDVELPEGTTFEQDVIASTDTGLTDVPPAVAILSKLPSRTLPPKTDGALAKASIYTARLKAEPALKDLRKAEWTGDHLAADWIDRLVMEALNLTNTFRSTNE